VKVVYAEQALRNLDDISELSDDLGKHSAFVSNSSSLASPNGRRARKKWRINPA
jgi:hypothetical protein